MPPPLCHLRLLDLSRQLPGPFCSTLLADLGMGPKGGAPITAALTMTR